MKEKIDNFFYYYKTHLIVAVLATILIVVGVRSCVNRKTTDLKVVYFSDKILTSESAEAFEKSLDKEGFIKDIDGDGETTFYMDSILHDFDIDGNADEATMNKIQATMYAGDHTLMLVHKYALEDYYDSYENITSIAKDMGIEDTFSSPQEDFVIGIGVSGNPYLEEMGINTDNLYVAMRRRTLKEEEKGKDQKQFDEAYKVMKYILSLNEVQD